MNLGIRTYSPELGQKPLMLLVKRHVGIIQHYGIVGLSQGTHAAGRINMVAFTHIFSGFRQNQQSVP